MVAIVAKVYKIYKYVKVDNVPNVDIPGKLLNTSAHRGAFLVSLFKEIRNGWQHD